MVPSNRVVAWLGPQDSEAEKFDGFRRVRPKMKALTNLKLSSLFSPGVHRKAPRCCPSIFKGSLFGGCSSTLNPKP